MRQKKKNFSNIEKSIINQLYRSMRPLSTSKVSTKTKHSWATTNKYLSELTKTGYVKKKKKGNANFWWLRE